MLNLHFAPSADILVPKLLGRIRSVWTDPLRPPTVLVASPAVGKWLQLRLADCDAPDSAGHPLGLGCVANIEMLTLERFLWKALRPGENMRRIETGILQQVICALIDEKLLKESSYKAVRAYLKKQDDTIDPVKRVQLASKIARQFQEYEFNRPSVWDETSAPDKNGRRWRLSGLDAHWLGNRTYFGNDAEHELWQKDLYCRANACIRQAGGRGTVQYISLPHLYRLRREEASQGGEWTVPLGTIFLFGVSKVSHFHRNALVEISQMKSVDMHVFLTNPCAEFWEDVDTWRSHGYRRKWRHDSPAQEAGVPARNPGDYGKSELGDFAHLPQDLRLLELWGLAGKENIYLWCPLAQWNFEYYCPDKVEQDDPPKTLLEALQKALLRREKDLRPKPWRDRNDGSLQVLACPDAGREVEELREQILDLVKEEKISRLNEIAVYLPDPGAYLAQIHRVFGACRPGDPGYIPFSVLGAPGSDSLFSQGMQTLLEIIEGRFDRAHVFALLRNPIVQSTRRISPDRVVIWETWAEELGIYRGFNKEHRRRMGDKGQTITDVHTFELGIARMLIGSLAAGPANLKYQVPGDSASTEYSFIPPFRDFDTPDADSLEQFCGLVEDLYNDVAQLTGPHSPASLSENVDAMTALADKWFGTMPEEEGWNLAAEVKMRADFLEALAAIKLQKDLARRDRFAGTNEFVSLVKECLPLELPAGSRAWTGGITFAPLRPAMIVPHRVIFAIGLGATAFPGSTENPTWDLLSRKRLVGDSDRVRDNRFAFLELLHAAQERLVLSFCSRNMQKEEDLQPSSVVLELESYLRDQGLASTDKATNEERCTIRRTIPWIVHESLGEIIAGGRNHGSWDSSEARLALLDSGPKAVSRYRADEARERPAQPAKGAVQKPLRTSIHDLRTFFANPLEYHLSRTLGIEIDETPSTMGATDEPLLSGNLEMSGLQKAIWTRILARVFPENKSDECIDAGILDKEASAIAEGLHRKYVVEAASPEAQLCMMEKLFLIQWARECVTRTIDVRQTFFDHVLMSNVDLSLKRPASAGDYAVDLGEEGKCSVECRHGLVLAPRQGTGPMAVIGFRKDGEARDNPDLWLAGVVQLLAEENRSESERLDVRLVQLNRGDGDGTPIEWNSASMKQENIVEIRKWLVAQIQDMLINRCADHLPFAVIKDLTKQNREKSLTWARRWAHVTGVNIEDKLSDEERGPYRCYLEAFKLVDAEVPFGNVKDGAERDRLLAEVARKRFAPMLEGKVHE